MDRGLYTATSGMLIQELRLDYIANNLANVNTFGFKANVGAVKSFPQMLVHRINDSYLKVSGVEGEMDLRPLLGSSSMGAVIDEISTDFEKGELRPTELPFDFAIDGDGFFMVETPYGQRMTRAGNFTLNANKELVTKEGYRVLGHSGITGDGNSTRIVLDPTRVFRVDEQGIFYYQNADEETGYIDYDEYVTRLRLVTVDDYKTIQKKGHNLFMIPEGHPQPHTVDPETVKVRQGVLEGSNVSAVTQLRSMIEVMRIYEANSKVIATKDALLGQAASQIGAKR